MAAVRRFASSFASGLLFFDGSQLPLADVMNIRSARWAFDLRELGCVQVYSHAGEYGLFRPPTVRELRSGRSTSRSSRFYREPSSPIDPSGGQIAGKFCAVFGLRGRYVLLDLGNGVQFPDQIRQLKHVFESPSHGPA